MPPPAAATAAATAFTAPSAAVGFAVGRSTTHSASGTISNADLFWFGVDSTSPPFTSTTGVHRNTSAVASAPRIQTRCHRRTLPVNTCACVRCASRAPRVDIALAARSGVDRQPGKTMRSSKTRLVASFTHEKRHRKGRRHQERPPRGGSNTRHAARRVLSAGRDARGCVRSGTRLGGFTRGAWSEFPVRRLRFSWGASNEVAFSFRAFAVASPCARWCARHNCRIQRHRVSPQGVR